MGALPNRRPTVHRPAAGRGPRYRSAALPCRRRPAVQCDRGAASPLGSLATFALHELAHLALFPIAAEQSLGSVNAERVERKPDAPADRRPDEPPRSPGEVIDKEQASDDNAEDGRVDMKSFELPDLAPCAGVQGGIDIGRRGCGRRHRRGVLKWPVCTIPSQARAVILSQGWSASEMPGPAYVYAPAPARRGQPTRRIE